MSAEEPSLFPLDEIPADPADGLSAGARLTVRNRQAIEAGVHPATGRPLTHVGACGTCDHHLTLPYHNGTYHKCSLHRLGVTHSTASDIRISWPSCTAYEPEASR